LKLICTIKVYFAIFEVPLAAASAKRYPDAIKQSNVTNLQKKTRKILVE